MNEPSHLFSSIQLASLTLPNRIVVSPMCQYSSTDGYATDWHLVHLGSRAVGGAALVIVEASAVSPEGRITPGDLGIYQDGHIEKLKRITDFVHAQGAAIGIQIAHAGRKASMSVPWEKERLLAVSEGGWTNVVGPSAVPFSETYATPHALDSAALAKVRSDFLAAAHRAVLAGFDAVEIHAAHGYLLHSFLSPLSNIRDDLYGGTFENRTRLVLEVADDVRRALPQRIPLLVRISATDWADGGWDIEASIKLARELKTRGVDLIDVSSGGLVPYAQIPAGPGYQIEFARRIRSEAAIATGTVGMIIDAAQADQAIRSGQADMVLLARELLRDPYWPLRAAQHLHKTASWPKQYLRAAPSNSPPRASISAN